MTDHIDAARKVLDEIDVPIGWSFHHRSEAEALDRANLLRTGIEQRAVKACEAWAVDGSGRVDAIAIGRESLAAKQPKPRWTVRQSVSMSPIISSGGWVIEDGIAPGHNLGGLTEAQARAVADVLNAPEAK